MTVQCKLIIGIRTSTSTTLTVTSTPGDPAPDLLVMTRGEETVAQVPFADGTWTTKLEAGDHIIRLELPDDSMAWFTAVMHVEVDHESIFVYHGPEGSETPHATVAWAATSVSAGKYDSKDPWPPPGTAVEFSDSTWFAGTLHTLAANIDNYRCHISGGPPPPRHQAQQSRPT
jgi:hypothetical protein